MGAAMYHHNSDLHSSQQPANEQPGTAANGGNEIHDVYHACDVPSFSEFIFCGIELLLHAGECHQLYTDVGDTEIYGRREKTSREDCRAYEETRQSAIFFSAEITKTYGRCSAEPERFFAEESEVRKIYAINFLADSSALPNPSAFVPPAVA